MKKKLLIPTICTKCKWFTVSRCNYDEDYWGDSFYPGIICFEPMNDENYPNPRKLLDLWDAIQNSMKDLEHTFITEKEIHNDLTDILPVISRHINAIEKFGVFHNKLREAYHKYPHTFEDEKSF